ncbi:MAG: helix-turn-helix transcriptional regulator [Oscillospiraceae bacterium]|nr:helix-turn-helix transcriptional regulator [Oscillospiraceae bacterium]
MSIFSERILALRDERKLSQAALAKEVGITSRTYQRYEAGEREPLMSTLVRMADFYGVSMDYLAGRTDTK